MAKLTTTDVANLIGAETTAISTINNNYDLIETAVENTLSRDGTSPNTMSADLDMNSNDILNLGTLSISGDSLTVATSQSPTSSGTGTQGEIAWDSDYLYVCTATNTWKRVALTGGY